MNSSIRISPTLAGLRFVVNIVHLTDRNDRPDKRRSLHPAAIPLENQPPLLIDANGVEAFQIAAQLFEMIAGWHSQVLARRSIVDHLDFSKQSIFEIGRAFPGFCILDEEVAQPAIPKANDYLQLQNE
jgi:hypothetical protein